MPPPASHHASSKEPTMRTTASLALVLALAACGGAQEGDTQGPATLPPEQGTASTAAPADEPAPPATPAPPAPETTPAGMPSPTSPAEPAGGRLSDAEIAAILDEADAGEVAMGQLALERSKNPTVRRLASELVKAHDEHRGKAKILFRAAGIEPLAGAEGRALAERGRADLERLRGLRGAAFDRAYVDLQVEIHASVIATVDERLVPSAQSPTLQGFLTDTRPALQAHLEHARAAQRSLGAR
jgi:putative membrane protein